MGRGASAPRPTTGAPAGEDGSQALEFAMVLPLLAAALVVLLSVVSLGGSVLEIRALALRLARHAAVAADADVLHSAAAVLGPGTEVRITPPTGRRHPGEVVRVEVTRALRIAWLPRVDLPITASASAVVEDVP